MTTPSARCGWNPILKIRLQTVLRAYGKKIVVP